MQSPRNNPASTSFIQSNTWNAVSSRAHCDLFNDMLAWLKEQSFVFLRVTILFMKSEDN
jgi:hypothetical protein